MSGAGVLSVASQTHQADATFSLAVWQRGSPTPGTSAIVPDATGPGIDLTDPPASRIVYCTAKRGMLMAMGGPVLLTMARGGTSVRVQPWFKDDTLGLWVKFGPTVNIVLGTSNVSPSALRNMAGAKIYVQIAPAGAGDIVGTVTEYGYDVV